MSKKIAQILVLGLISVFLVVLPVGAQTAKQPAPATKASNSSEFGAAKAVPNDSVKVVQGDLKKEGYKLKVDGLMDKHTGLLSSNIGRKKALS